jgi:hypothetical protein
MKQTAMQKLKWFVSDGLDCFDESIKVSEIWEKINELLEIEKQQIIDAYNKGCSEIHLYYEFIKDENITQTKEPFSAEQYYNEQFKNK